MYPKSIILVSGYMKSGKDTLGRVAVERFNFQRFAFADALKDEVASRFAIDRKLLDSQEGKGLPLDKLTFDRTNPIFIQLMLDEKAHGYLDLQHSSTTVRQLLIAYGMSMRRQNSRYWAEEVAEQIQQTKASFAIITDWRYPNELEAISDAFPDSNIQTMRVERFHKCYNMDPSETMLDEFHFDYVINNNECLERFISKVTSIFYQWPFIKFLVMDVDDVLVKWFDAFQVFLREQGYLIPSHAPTSWNLSGWLSMTDEQVLHLVSVFNSSEAFGKLQPYDDAEEFLIFAKDAAYCTIALTCCSDDAQVRRLRHECLQRFTKRKLISHVTCLALGASKKEFLSKLHYCTFVDDNPQHVLDADDLGHRAILMERPWGNYEPKVSNLDSVVSLTDLMTLL